MSQEIAVLSQEKAASSGQAVPAANPANVGQWSAVIPLANVPIHTHLLPTGKVLFWGRRNPPGSIASANDFDSLNQRQTQALIWDPADPDAPAKPTSKQPTDSDGNPINLFCSGHTFLEDGRLLVTGGHLFDSQGLNTTTFYDPFADKWTPGPTMNNGRWYPTAVTLPDGRAFVISGSFATGPLAPPLPNNPNQSAVNPFPQILQDGSWHNVTDFDTLPLFPRIHVAPNGFLFMSGSLATTYYFENLQQPGNPGTWVPIDERSAGNAEYAPSVMYDVGKVVFIGGGGGGDTGEANLTSTVEVIDLNAQNPAWAKVAPMNFPRRQHNATLLPDGTVFVTGGSQGAGFDNLNSGNPVHTSELFDPSNGTWTEMAPEAVDRCYHSTAVLLPDGRVFSGGGGEYAPNPGESNPPVNSHADAQLFSPPYLFKGPRPVITKAPASVAYGEIFVVETPAPGEIKHVTWIRLSSVTHSFNPNQRINSLDLKPGANQLTVTAPANGNVCPPGHYMLFLLNQNKVPSIAVIIQVTAPAAAPIAAASHFQVLRQISPQEKDAAIQAREKKPPVVVGVTPTCPYGLSACWGGAYEALKHLHGVRLIRPLPNAEDSTAYVYLAHEGLPDLDVWPTEFAKIANGTHVFRGVELTVEDLVQIREGDTLIMHGDDLRPPVLLQPMEPADKIQWDFSRGSAKPLDSAEQHAYSRLQEQVKAASNSLRATVTGPLKKSGDRYVLEVREFSLPKAGSKG
jgi:galactose oxidase